MPPTRTRNAMKASSRRVREGVFRRYWFHTWRATSCGEDLFDRDELGFEGAVEGVEEERTLECEGTGFGGGGVALDEGFLGAIACSDPKDRESRLPEVGRSGR
jgi:hypothetical protein